MPQVLHGYLFLDFLVVLPLFDPLRRLWWLRELPRIQPFQIRSVPALADLKSVGHPVLRERLLV